MKPDLYFKALCDVTAKETGSASPKFSAITEGKNRTEKTGVAATFTYSAFKMNLYYFQSGKSAYCPNTLWLTFVLDCKPDYPFSVYDILAFCMPNDFKCYTYTYIDSKELLDTCFSELNQLFKTLLPRLSQVLENGTEKNRLLNMQKENITAYFGENILEQNEALGGVADKLMDMMILNFFQYQIENAVVGNLSLFFGGNTEKAIKKLKKSKRLSQYEKIICENFGNFQSPQASPTPLMEHRLKNQAKYKKAKIANVRFFTLVSLAFLPLFFLGFSGIFLLYTNLVYGDAPYICGIKEILVTMPIIALLPASISALGLLRSKIKNENKKSKKTKGNFFNRKNDLAFKYASIFIECMVAAMLFMSFNSPTVFAENKIIYTDEALPLSSKEIRYDNIDFFAIIDGYTYENKFINDPYAVFVTTSGITVDLYDSTYIDGKNFFRDTAPFLSEKGIKILQFKTADEIEDYLRNAQNS